MQVSLLLVAIGAALHFLLGMLHMMGTKTNAAVQFTHVVGWALITVGALVASFTLTDA